MTKKDIRKLAIFHMRCLRDILGVTLWHKRRNADVLREAGEHLIEHQLRQKKTTVVWSLAKNARPPHAKASIEM